MYSFWAEAKYSNVFTYFIILSFARRSKINISKKNEYNSHANISMIKSLSFSSFPPEFSFTKCFLC